jgi:aspartate 1-decarboxylase
MMIEVLKSKIHRATVTRADLHYIGSITIDADLMDAVNIIENERVYIYDINNGERFDTYAIKGARGSGEIGINGAAARKTVAGDLVIIVSYASMTIEEAKNHKPMIIFPDKNNKLTRSSKKKLR